LRWSDLFRVYRPALIWCGLTAGAVAGTATLLRLWDAWPVAVLVASLSAALLTVVAASRLLLSIIGEHGRWMMTTLGDQLKAIRRSRRNRREGSA
jgi:hypothetical protein